MTDRIHPCTTCFRFVATSALFAAALVVASTAFAQVLDEVDGLQRPPGPIDAKAVPVTGRVLDTQGAAIGKARVLIIASEYARSARPMGVGNGSYVGTDVLPLSFEVVGPVETDDHGKFALHVPASRSGVYAGLNIYAVARGHGCATKLLGQTANREPIELALGAEHVIRGRLIDLKGQPVAGVTVRIFKPGWRPPSRTLEIWEPVTTDDKGRFLIRGLDSDRVSLQIEGEQITPQRSSAIPVSIDSDDQTTLSLAPAKRIHGKITFGDTGKPAANVRIISPNQGGGLGEWIESRADVNGDYSISPFALRDNPYREGYKLNVFPPTGERYLVAEVTVPPSRAANHQVDIKFERGVLIRGRVTETASGAPVAGARVQHIALRSFATESTGLQTAITAADGTFELPVPAKPGGDPRIPVPDKPGHLLVLGPTLDFIKVETSQQELQIGRKPGLQRQYADAVVRLDFEPGTAEYAVDIKLRKGVRLKGKVLDPDGKPASEFVLFSRSYLAEGYRFSYSGPGAVLECRYGEFELPGCDPDQTHTVHFFDRKNGWGATAALSRKHESEPAVVHLEPCGSVEARFVDANGKPLAKFHPQYACALTDGAPRPIGGLVTDDFALAAVLFTKYVIDRKRDVPPRPNPGTNDDGHIVFSGLIPGARHMLYWTPQDPGKDPAPFPHVEFTVRAGEKKDLGDIVMTGRLQ